MKNRVRLRFNALAGAIAILGGLASLDANALALGQLRVQSSLGEPLRAEIDIVEINQEEASSLRAGIASPEAFKSAGLDYSPAVAGVQISLEKRADGRSYLRLSSNRPVSEPFVDLMLDASWSSGRVVRDYTLLFDPPSLRGPSTTTATPQSPAVPQLPRAASEAAGGVRNTPRNPPPVAAARPAPMPRAQTEKAAPVPRPEPGGQQVTVKAGDTAGKIAAQNRPASVSLDQMLIALLQSNPDAFVGGNVNRLKSGAVLDMPGADEAAGIGTSEATRTLAVQSRDFNEFRRKLAEGAPATRIDSANRQASGKVQAQVEDKGPAAATPDKLTLSKGAVQGKDASLDRIAQDRQARQASERVAELAKNISDLNKITAPPASVSPSAASKSPGLAVPNPGLAPAPGATAAVTAASAAKAPPPVPAAAPVPAPGTVLNAPVTAAGTTVPGAVSAALPAASEPAPPASAAASAASAPEAATSTPAVAAPVVKKPVVMPAPVPEPSLMDELAENPLVLPGLGALALLLAGFGFYRYKKRRNSVQVDSSFLESRLQPDSFFGASGGQRIDTNEGGATGSSLVYSPSQLDAAGDVDPVAEADVYLAYGRDLQAEEILKEALRTTPSRVAIHAKLMEIYAKRRDAKAFEVVAADAFALTRGEGPEWAYIGEMGRDLDPGNPMYKPGGQPGLPASKPSAADKQSSPSQGFGASTMPQMLEPEVQAPTASVDFDLDFSLDEQTQAPVAVSAKPPVSAAAPRQPAPPAPVPEDPIFDGLEMDFSIPAAAPPPEPRALVATAALPAARAAAAPAPVAAALDSGMLEFDLGSISLDLAVPATESPSLTAGTPMSDDPLETKFALAEEFRALGDQDGARSLAEEVASQASGSLKSKAQAFLNALS